MTKLENQITATKQQQYLFNLTEVDKINLIANKSCDDPNLPLYYERLDNHEQNYQEEMGWA